MRGGFVHNKCLIDPVAACSRDMGLPIALEVPVGPGRRAGHVDLVVGEGDFRIAVEAECTPRRVDNDLGKAARLGVQELWIIVPSPRVGRAIVGVLYRSGMLGAPCPVFVLSQLQARQRLAVCFPLYFAAKVLGTERNES
ncbi:hypothetical protein PHYC_02043 [Phycisphaerales bacterium]|nr:hypothetical protein PHYC_02043 [Phycisphaerales bacterium]